MRQHAHRPEDKEKRRQTILAAARRVWGTSTFGELTMSRVARRARLAKGTLYLYFPTKEALLLSLLESSLERYLSDLERRFAKDDAPRDADGAAEVIASTLLANEPLVGLLAILGAILEHNLPEARILQFKRWLLSRLERTGGCLAQRLPFLGKGGGLRLLLHLQALIAGLGGLTQPAPAVARVLALPGFEPFRIDFGTELRDMLAALLRGQAAQMPGEPVSSTGPERTHEGHHDCKERDG